MKNYFIVGGSSGIGLALTNQLAAQGHRVYATYCNTIKEDQSTSTTYHHLDVMSAEQDLGFLPDQLDGFVYCPGSIKLLPFHRIKSSDFVKDYQLQVTGAINILQAILSKLKASSNASVVFFSTVAVQQGFNFHAQVAASKGAIEGLTRALAAELSPVIRVNAIAPSITNTPLAAKLLNTEDKITANAERHPLKTIGTPENIADAAAFLLSDKSAWMTGTILPVDGGMSTIKN